MSGTTPNKLVVDAPAKAQEQVKPKITITGNTEAVATLNKLTVEDYLRDKQGVSGAEIPASVGVVVNGLKRYIDVMGAPHSVNEGVQSQVEFTNLVRKAFYGDYAVSKMAIDTMLYMVSQHLGDVFSARLAMRHVDKIPTTTLEPFKRLMLLVTTAANPVTRYQTPARVSLDMVKEAFVNDVERENLMRYFAKM